jgi:hypothetical protein
MDELSLLAFAREVFAYFYLLFCNGLWQTRILKGRKKTKYIYFYSVFQGFSKAKFANGGSILSSSQFSILPQLAQKMKLTSKVVKVDSKIIISLPKI